MVSVLFQRSTLVNIVMDFQMEPLKSLDFSFISASLSSVFELRRNVRPAARQSSAVTAFEAMAVDAVEGDSCAEAMRHTADVPTSLIMISRERLDGALSITCNPCLPISHLGAHYPAHLVETIPSFMCASFGSYTMEGTGKPTK